MHSAMTLVPIDPTTDQLLTGELPGFVVGRSTRADLTQSATEFFPTDPTLIIDIFDTPDPAATTTRQGGVAQAPNGMTSDAFLYVLQSYLSSLVAATTGAIGILPDFLGYGESHDVNRATLTLLPSQQAFALGYLASREQVASISNGCTRLRDFATVGGKVWADESRL